MPLLKCLKVVESTISDWVEDSDGLVHVHKDVIKKATDAAIAQAEDSLSLTQIAQVFNSWKDQAGKSEELNRLWNCLLDDLKMAATKGQN